MSSVNPSAVDIASFVNVTNTDTSTARKYLQEFNSDVSRAVDAFYERSHKYQRVTEGNRSALTTLFAKYESEEDDGSKAGAIFGDELKQLFDDMKIDMKSLGPLVVAYRLNLKNLGEISKTEFVEGFAKLGASNMTAMSKVVTDALKLFSTSPDSFKNFYKWLFVYAKGDAPKFLPINDAVAMWRSVLPYLPWSFERWQQWCTFIKSKKSPPAGQGYITKDLWNGVFDFSKKVDKNFSNHSVDDAWNSELDEFVAAVKKEENLP